MEPASASSQLASPNTMLADLPPSSNDSRLSVLEAVVMIVCPVTVSPVNEMSLMSGCSASRVPTTGPGPATMLSTPSGSPASAQISPSSSGVMGATEAGLMTHVLPAARHGPAFQVVSMNG